MRQRNVSQCFEVTVTLFVHPARHKKVTPMVADLSKHQLHGYFTVTVVLWHHHTHSSVPSDLHNSQAKQKYCGQALHKDMLCTNNTPDRYCPAIVLIM